MQRILPVIAGLTLLLAGNVAHAQKTQLKTDGWGSISGKATFEGVVPAASSLEDLMKKHNDKACCLDPNAKAIEKVDNTWVVDPKTKAVANVIIWLAPPKGTYFPTHESYKKRKDDVIIDQPHCAFVPHVAVYNPEYFDGTKLVLTGQKLIIKNSAVVSHNTRVLGTKNGFNKTLPAKTELDIEPPLEPERLPLTVQCDLHPWMKARLLVIDHPYYAVTKADGTFTMPIVPAGAELNFIAWHEAVGYVVFPGTRAVSVANKKNTEVDFKVKAEQK